MERLTVYLELSHGNLRGRLDLLIDIQAWPRFQPPANLDLEALSVLDPR